MANSRSARKRIRANEHKHERNRAVRSAVRTRIGKARRALLNEPESSLEQVRSALVSLDKAASKGVLHARNAARRKSRLAKLANKLAAATESGARAAAVGGAKGRSVRGGRAAKSTTKAAPKAASKAASSRSGAKPAAKTTASTAKATTRSPRTTKKS